MAFKMKGAPYPKRTKTFTTDDAGNVQKTVTRTNRKGDVKSTKVVDYDASGTRTKKAKTTNLNPMGLDLTRTVEGKGLDAVVTDRRGRTNTRRENIKRDVGNTVKGAAIVGAGMGGGMVGSMLAASAGGSYAATTAAGLFGVGVGSDIATKITGGTPNDLGGTVTKQTLEGTRNLVSGIKTGIKNIPSKIKKKVHAKRQSKAKK